ncbi:hypothetical protein KKF84_02825 [Myxococcota bacterium]|nr:hypothetical protein [Myxococcota bacterium]MBU1534224.1 hypothetical protein [Myxococcota bacterium]
MANILVYMETHEGRIIPTCLRALEMGRKLASELGATLYSILSVKEISESNQDLLYQIAAYKTDRLIVASSPVNDGPPRVATDGQVLAKITEKYPPNLFLFGDSPAALELASYVSSKIRAIFARDYQVTINETVVLTVIDHLMGHQVILDEDELEQPVVAIVRGEPETMPHDFNELEIIAVKNDITHFQRDFYMVKHHHYHGEGALVVAGGKAAPYLNEMVSMARLKEWTLLAAPDLVGSMEHQGIPLFNSRARKSGRKRILLFGLTARDMDEIIRFSSFEDKYLLIDCEADVPGDILRSVTLTGTPLDSIRALEESMY